MVMPELAFFLITLPVTIWAAWGDLKYMKITNRLNLTLFALFLVSGVILLPLQEFGIRLAIGFLALVVGFILNARGNLGGGDAKYIAAFIPFVAPGDMGLFFFILSLCLLAAVVVHRTARRIPALRATAADWASWGENRRFPMGLGLSGAFSFYLAVKAFSLPVALV